MSDKMKGKERKPYKTPVVSEYGSVEDLTRGTGGAASDFGQGASRAG
jgi:hypothetical protein